MLFFLALLFISSLLVTHVWGIGKVSFTSDKTGNLDIYIIDIDGKNPLFCLHARKNLLDWYRTKAIALYFWMTPPYP